MDPRLEFAFQLLMDGTGLPRHEIMDFIFEGDMVRMVSSTVVSLINFFFVFLVFFFFLNYSYFSKIKLFIRKVIGI